LEFQAATTQPSVVDAPLTPANAAVATGTVTPTTEPSGALTAGPSGGPTAAPTGEPAGQARQAAIDAGVEQPAYYCRNLTQQQAQDLEGLLASRPGQSTQVIAPTQSLDFGDMSAAAQNNTAQVNAPQINAPQINAAPANAAPANTAQANAAPANTAPINAAPTLSTSPTPAPATQPVVAFGAAQSDSSNITSQQALSLQQQLQQPADKQTADFDLQQSAAQVPPQAPQQQIGAQQGEGAPQAQQPQAATPLVDLLIVVRKEPPATQPATGLSPAGQSPAPPAPAMNAPR
jgi:hypothetical protein